MLHMSDGAFILPNPGDAGTARLLEGAGFKALATSSAALAFSMGVPDGKAPRATMMRHIAEIAAATALPVSADLGDGFGLTPETVAETIELAAAAGAVGGSIEDSTGDPRAPLLPLSLAVERIAAAVEAARSLPFPFMITARAEHFLVDCHDLDGVLERFDAYKNAGAHVLYAPCLPDDAIEAAVAAASPCPVNVLARGRGIGSCVERLSRLGVKRVSIGSGLARLAFGAITAAIDELKVGSFEFLDRAIGLSTMNELFGAVPEQATAAHV